MYKLQDRLISPMLNQLRNSAPLLFRTTRLLWNPLKDQIETQIEPLLNEELQEENNE